MKYFIALVFLFVLEQCQAQVRFQIRLLRDQLGGAPIEGVQISGDESLVTTLYKGDGKYELRIDDRKPGEAITLSIYKKYLAVVNWEALRVTIPDPSNKNVTSILLCLENQRDKYRELYYQLVVRQNFNAENEKQLKNQRPKLPGKNGDQQEGSAEADPALIEQIVHSIATTRPEEVDEEYNHAFTSFINRDYEHAKSILKIEKLLPEQYAALQAIRQSWIALQRANKKLELRATIAIGEANPDLALYLYRTIARSDSSNLAVVLNLVSLLSTKGSLEEAALWIGKTENVVAKNNDDSLRKLYLVIAKRGLLHNMTIPYLDSLQQELPSIARSPGALSAGLYSLIGVVNLGYGREANGLQLLRASDRIITPEFRAQQKTATLLLLLQAYSQNKEKEDSLFQELISVSRSGYVKEKSISNTVLYLNSLVEYAHFKSKNNDEDTTSTKRALDLVIAHVKETPNAPLVVILLKGLEAYSGEDDDKQAESVKEKMYLKLIADFKHAQVATKKNYDLVLCFLEYCLGGLYADSDSLGTEEFLLTHLRRHYRQALTYAKRVAEDNEELSPLVGILIESFADDSDIGIDDDQRQPFDSCRLYIQDLYSDWSQHTATDKDKFRLAVLIKGMLAAELIPDSLLSISIYQGLNAFQDIYAVYKDEPTYIGQYSSFLNSAEKKLEELHDRPKLKELIWQRYAIQQERLELLPFQRREDYASAIWPILQYQVSYENPAVAEGFLDSLIRQTTARSTRDSNYLYVALAIYEHNLTGLVDSLWKTDTSVYTRWETRYYKVLMDSHILESKGDTRINSLTEFISFEKRIKRLRSDTLYGLYRAAGDPNRKLQLCQQALAELRRPVRVDVHFEYKNGGEDNQVNPRENMVNWLVRAARANILKKDFRSAQDSIDRAFASDSTSGAAMVTQAHIYWLTNRFAEAERLYAKYKESSYISDGYSTAEGTKYIMGEIAELKAAGLVIQREEELQALLARK